MAFCSDAACAHSLTMVKDAVRWGRKGEEAGSPLLSAQLGAPLPGFGRQREVLLPGRAGGPEAAPRTWPAAGGDPPGPGRGARGRSPDLSASGRKSSRAGPGGQRPLPGLDRQREALLPGRAGGAEAAPRALPAAGGKTSRAGPNEPQHRSGLAAEERTARAGAGSSTRTTARRVRARARPVGNGRTGPGAPAASRGIPGDARAPRAQLGHPPLLKGMGRGSGHRPPSLLGSPRHAGPWRPADSRGAVRGTKVPAPRVPCGPAVLDPERR
jgi:hypothetical protein